MAKKTPDEQAVSIIEIQSERKFNFRLQVVNPFNDYQKGQLISSDKAIQAVIDKNKLSNCNRLPRS